MALLGRLTAPSICAMWAAIRPGWRRRPISERTNCLNLCNWPRNSRKLVTDFSHGTQKKLAMAAAVIHGPKVLFLDEPFEGVDAIAAGMIKTMLTGNDELWEDYFSDHSRAGNCGAAVQSCGNHLEKGGWSPLDRSRSCELAWLALCPALSRSNGSHWRRFFWQFWEPTVTKSRRRNFHGWRNESSGERSGWRNARPGSPGAVRGHGSNALADVCKWSALYSRPA